MSEAGPQVSRRSLGAATLLTIEDHSLPVVRFLVALPTGGLADPPERSGLMSTTLEMLLRGTERQSRQQFNDSLDELGSGLWSFVGSDTALVRGTTLLRHLQRTVELAIEALTQPRFDAGEHQRLIDETVDELQAERDEDGAVVEHFLRRALYRGHPLSRSPAGCVADLRRFEPDDTRRIYEGLRRAGGMVVAFAGDITADRAAELMQPLVTELSPDALQAAQIPAIPEPPATQITVVDKPDRTQVQMRIARSTMSGAHPDTLAFWLGTMAFGGTFTSRFTREVRDVRGWSYVAYASYPRRQRLPAPLVLKTAPAVGDAVACLELELELYAELARGELEPAAVERARSYLLGRYPFETATAADLLIPAVQNDMLGRPPEDLLAAPQRIEAVDAAAVGPLMQRHLDSERVVVTLVATADRIVPALEKRFAGAQIEVVDYRAELDGSFEDQDGDSR